MRLCVWCMYVCINVLGVPLDLPNLTQFQEFPEQGILATCQGVQVWVGNAKLVQVSRPSLPHARPAPLLSLSLYRALSLSLSRALSFSLSLFLSLSLSLFLCGEGLDKLAR